jgi:hypothetical protein
MNGYPPPSDIMPPAKDKVMKKEILRLDSDKQILPFN